ncbi:hypothetical protein EVAR_101290_1 [Eumeta japonica]|uniref:Uncharacterized protein n=1 Tax=Eumeta variegata TaxID=151549 RepID=A0A4C2AEB1_EUMVA|nr:hypothetical protein EVAR_101290_1 [Eumeta japonica]
MLDSCRFKSRCVGARRYVRGHSGLESARVRRGGRCRQYGQRPDSETTISLVSTLIESCFVLRNHGPSSPSYSVLDFRDPRKTNRILV